LTSLLFSNSYHNFTDSFEIAPEEFSKLKVDLESFKILSLKNRLFFVNPFLVESIKTKDPNKKNKITFVGNPTAILYEEFEAPGFADEILSCF